MWERLKATGRAIKHRRLTLALLIVFLTVGVIGGIYSFIGNEALPGQTQDGDHEIRALADVRNDAFCENCHNTISEEIIASPHSGPSSCTTCHSPSGADHAAASSACTDCHDADVIASIESPTEAHNGIMASLGETQSDASQTCQSCHTHAAVGMTVFADAPIPLQMGTPPAP